MREILRLKQKLMNTARASVTEERGLNYICLYKISRFHKTIEAFQKFNENGITIKIGYIKKDDNLTSDQAYEYFMKEAIV